MKTFLSFNGRANFARLHVLDGFFQNRLEFASGKETQVTTRFCAGASALALSQRGKIGSFTQVVQDLLSQVMDAIPLLGGC